MVYFWVVLFSLLNRVPYSGGPSPRQSSKQLSHRVVTMVSQIKNEKKDTVEVTQLNQESDRRKYQDSTDQGKTLDVRLYRCR